MRFCNADGFEVVTLKSNSVSKRFEPLFDERPVGTRRSEDGDRTREEPVDLFPFAGVQVGPNCEFGRRIAAVAVECGPADATATRGYSESEADWLL